MKNKVIITILVILISIGAISAAATGIWSCDGNGEYKYSTIRGEEIKIYGKGIYKDMSSDVAIQGIAQDYLTLFIAVPMLLYALYFARKSNTKGKIALSGILLYFLLTYLFYTAMAMYNSLFLVYTALLSMSFFAFVISMFEHNTGELMKSLKSISIIRTAAIFLIINGTLVAIMWLSVIVPPLINGNIYPNGLQHYTTMIVQGFDLGLFLPMAFVSGIMAVKNKPYGFLFVVVYMVFLSFLMGALCLKIAFMAYAGANVIPVVFIMPTIGAISTYFAIKLLTNIQSRSNNYNGSNV